MKKLFLFLAVVGTVIFTLDSCKKSVSLDELRAQEENRLDSYLAYNNITDSLTASGMYYIERVKGTGDSIKTGDRVKIFYTAMYIVDDTTTTVFDYTGNYVPYEFVVGANAVAGLNEGLTYMKQGGKATFIIPSSLGFGATNNYTYGVPRFSTLIYNVEVYRHYPADTTTTQ